MQGKSFIKGYPQKDCLGAAHTQGKPRLKQREGCRGGKRGSKGGKNPQRKTIKGDRANKNFRRPFGKEKQKATGLTGR